jgi:alcohol dehydrogenase
MSRAGFFYEFEWPLKIVAGPHALEHLAFEMRRLGMKRVLLLSDEGLEKVGWVKRVRAQMAEEAHVVEFTRIPPDSDAAVLAEIYALCARESIAGIVALGGGSVLDSAKALTLMIAHRKSDLREIENYEVYTERPVAHIAIATTSGTGSESSHSAVIKDGHQKRLLAGPALYPHVAFLDPELTEKMPLRLAVATGLDAWTHAWESLLSLQVNPVSKALARAAVKTLARDLPQLPRTPSDLQLRQRLAESATFAGIAFTHSMLGMAHALGHTLASIRPVHHGEAVTLFFLHSLAPIMAKTPEFFDEILEDCPFEALRAPTRPTYEALWDFLVSFRRETASGVGIVLSLEKLGVARTDLPKLARGALMDGPSLFSPYAWDEPRLVAFLEKTYDKPSWSLDETRAWIV